MDIEHFYAGDPRRRGDDVVLGDDWRDRGGRTWRLAWIPGTDELVVTHLARPRVWTDPLDLGDGHEAGSVPSEVVVVEVLALVPAGAQLGRVLRGSHRWRASKGGVERLHRRLRRRGLAVARRFDPMGDR